MLWLYPFWILTSLVLNAIAILQGENVGNVSKLANGEIKVSGHEEFPYMVRMSISGEFKNENGLLEHKRFLCGGVIIDPYAVLTAAHCFSGAVGAPYVIIKAGLLNLKYEDTIAIKSTMENYFTYDGYLEGESKLEAMRITVLSDIAIVWLDIPVGFWGKVKKAVLHTSENDPPTNSEGWIVGWGSTTMNGSKPSDTLKKAKVKVMNKDECQALCGNVAVIEDMFCVRSENTKSSASDGDSGGPFVLNGTVYGISSFGLSKKQNGKYLCDPTRPELYTNVGRYTEWIKEEVEWYRKDKERKNDLLLSLFKRPLEPLNKKHYRVQPTLIGRRHRPRKSRK